MKLYYPFGFDIDMMEAFSSQIHVLLKMIDIRWDGIIPALLSKKCDFIAGGMSVTQDRTKIVAFSDPILKNGIAILANKIYVPDEESLQNMDKKKLTFAIRTGTSADAYLSKFPPKNLVILKFDDNATLINALLTGKVNAITQDRTLLIPVLKSHLDKFRILKEPILEEDIAIAARKQDKKLLFEFNQFLINWKKSDKYNQYIKEYF